MWLTWSFLLWSAFPIDVFFVAHYDLFFIWFNNVLNRFRWYFTCIFKLQEFCTFLFSYLLFYVLSKIGLFQFTIQWPIYFPAVISAWSLQTSPILVSTKHICRIKWKLKVVVGKTLVYRNGFFFFCCQNFHGVLPWYINHCLIFTTSWRFDCRWVWEVPKLSCSWLLSRTIAFEGLHLLGYVAVKSLLLKSAVKCLLTQWKLAIKSLSLLYFNFLPCLFL